MTTLMCTDVDYTHRQYTDNKAMIFIDKYNTDTINWHCLTASIFWLTLQTQLIHWQCGLLQVE